MKTRKMTIAVSVLVFLLAPFSVAVFLRKPRHHGSGDNADQPAGDRTPGQGGAGSLFDMAKGMLPEGPTGQVASAIPGVQELIGALRPCLNPRPKKSDKLAGLAGGLLGP
ncbi:MAG: hypothetical protein R2874_10360 [Desulfobacterales bacterium]